jgi:hypothetical protein
MLETSENDQRWSKHVNAYTGDIEEILKLKTFKDSEKQVACETANN